MASRWVIRSRDTSSCSPPKTAAGHGLGCPTRRCRRHCRTRAPSPAAGRTLRCGAHPTPGSARAARGCCTRLTEARRGPLRRRPSHPTTARGSFPWRFVTPNARRGGRRRLQAGGRGRRQSGHHARRGADLAAREGVVAGVDLSAPIGIPVRRPLRAWDESPLIAVGPQGSELVRRRRPIVDRARAAGLSYVCVLAERQGWLGRRRTRADRETRTLGIRAGCVVRGAGCLCDGATCSVRECVRAKRAHQAAAWHLAQAPRTSHPARRSVLFLVFWRR